MVEQFCILREDWVSLSREIFVGNGEFVSFEVEVVEFVLESRLLVLARSELGPLAVEIDLEKIHIGVLVLLGPRCGVVVISSFCAFIVKGRELITFCHFLR
jgi:hypothetical protein